MWQGNVVSSGEYLFGEFMRRQVLIISFSVAVLAVGCCAADKTEVAKDATAKKASGVKVDLLIDYLQKSDKRDCYEAIRAAGRHRVTEAVPYLIPLLKDRKLKFSVIYTLGNIGDKRATKAITVFLADEEQTYIVGAATALGKIGDPAAVPALVDALKHKDSNTRREAAWALGTIASPQGAQPLRAALEDKSPLVRAQAASALCNVAGKNAEASVIPLLEDKDKSVRTHVLDCLTKIVTLAKPIPSKNRKNWLARLKSKHSQMRCYTVRKLGLTGDKQVVQPIANMLTDQSNAVIMASLAALNNLGTEEAISAVMDIVKDRKYYTESHDSAIIWFTAVEVLSSRKDPRVLEPLLNALKDGYNNGIYLQPILLGLGQLGDKRAIGPLQKLLDEIFVGIDTDGMITAVLAKLGDEKAFDRLSKAAIDETGEERELAAIWLGYTESTRAEPLLVRLLSDQLVIVRRAAVDGLGKTPHPSKTAVSALKEILQDKDESVRLAAAKALKKIKRNTTTKPHLTTKPATRQ